MAGYDSELYGTAQYDVLGGATTVARGTATGAYRAASTAVAGTRSAAAAAGSTRRSAPTVTGG
jgi:hypothetical protein